MMDFFRSKRADVLSHWYTLIPNFGTSAKEFYESVEKALKDRQVPGLEISRVEFSEGGILSDNREYLRMSRERLVFDVCGAPFGTSYFFSCRFAEIPAVIRLWQLIMLFLVFSICADLSFIECVKIFGPHYSFSIWLFGWVVAIALLIYALRNVSAMGFSNLDAMLIKSPLLGAIYERWFRRATYYRYDTRIMYCDTVDGVVRALVEDIAATKGVKLQINRYSPMLDELYKPLPPKEPVK